MNKKVELLKPFSKIIIRTPLQPINDYKNCFEKKINELTVNVTPLFLEGLYLSSPEFLTEIEKAKNSPNINEKDKNKILNSYRKYWLRSCTRSTPYGTLAGCGTANLTNNTQLNLNSFDTYTKCVRIDMNYLTMLINQISKIPSIQENILFFPNNSIYELPDSYRYVEYSVIGSDRFYHLQSIEKEEYLSKIIKISTNGTKLSSLVETILNNDPNIEVEEANLFIEELINTQVLVSELEPNLTGEDPFKVLLNKLKETNQNSSLTTYLQEIISLLSNPKNTIEYYKVLESKIAQLNNSARLPKNLFQTDLLINLTSNNVEKDIIEEITKQLSLLTIFCRKNKNEALTDFITKFYEKFEEQEIPLSMAIDAELGVGYYNLSDATTGNSELINGLFTQDLTGANESITIDYIAQFVEEKYNDYLATQKEDIVITEEDINQLTKTNKQKINVPSSMSAFGNLLGNKNKLEKNTFKFNLISFIGPSAANLIGRFAYANETINNLVQETCRKEEQTNPNAIYAEIVHLPQARIGNILLRPTFREYEIPFIGISGVEEKYQIPISDLYVSLKNGKIILTSKRLQKEIIPRLTTAHNYNFNSLPLYKFLCDLKFQDTNPTINWDWGMKEKFTFLPRVSFKNIILKRALWNIYPIDCTVIISQKEIPYKLIEDLRINKKIPSKVLIIEGDNELLIDFEIKESVFMLYEKMKKKQAIILAEYLFTDDNCIVLQNERHFANEIVIPMFKETTVTTSINLKNKQASPINLKRKFYPNSEWLYFKIYGGSKSNEKILTEQILPLVTELEQDKLITSFFFIRYIDPQPHLRIRFLNSLNPENNILVQKKVFEILQPLLEKNIVHKITIDTYNRELERYDFNTIEHSESLFFNDSAAVLKLLNLLDGAESEYYRWIMAIVGIDGLLNDFELILEDKIKFITILQSNFFKEFGGSKTLQQQLSDKYRKHQKNIFEYMNRQSIKSDEIEEVYQIIDERTNQNLPIIQKILNELKIHSKSIFETELLPSYIHMFMNRLFIVQQRKYELVIYDFMQRYYNSQLVIQNKHVNV